MMRAWDMEGTGFPSATVAVGSRSIPQRGIVRKRREPHFRGRHAVREAPLTGAAATRGMRAGSKLATAMEARGFGAYPTRTWARPSPFGAREFALIAAGFVIASAAVTVSVASGAWNFIGTR